MHKLTNSQTLSNYINLNYNTA